MEEPSEECEIEEESYYSEDFPQVDYSTGKVSWILKKGWGIGKKLLITGAVISSAPFVLPPLVVTSAIAFACWVPCGVVMASYTCSEKIMSKLLPYNSTDEEEEEFEDAEEGGKVDVGEYLDMEEKPQWEEINGARMEGLSYEYNDDDLLDENAISDGVDIVVFDVIEDREEFGVSPIEVTRVILEGSEAQEKVSDLLEEDELLKETRGLLEKIREEGSADDVMEMENHYSDITPGSREDYNLVSDDVDIYVSNVTEGEVEMLIEEPEEKEIVNDFMENEELVKETRGLLEGMRDAGSADNDAVAILEPVGVVEEGEEETDEITKSNLEETESADDKSLTNADVGLGMPTSTMEGGFPKGSEKSEERTHVKDAAVSEDWGSVSESKNAGNNSGVESQVGEIRIVNNIVEAEKSISDMSVDLRVVSTVVEETHAPVMNKEEVLQTERGENNISQVKFPSIREKKNVLFTNADAREIADESGLYVFDENNASGHVGEEGAEFAELPISSRVSESTDDKTSPRKEDIHSNGVLKNEDKIRKQIEAIRSIVGYKVTPHASYMEELKALYIFTGVEPPTSFHDPPDLTQVNNNLRFLMSIIGLK